MGRPPMHLLRTTKLFLHHLLVLAIVAQIGDRPHALAVLAQRRGLAV